jgi:hypothetical protein
VTGVREIFANVLERRPYPIDEVDSLDLEAVEALASHALPIEVRRSLMIR